MDGLLSSGLVALRAAAQLHGVEAWRGLGRKPRPAFLPACPPPTCLLLAALPCCSPIILKERSSKGTLLGIPVAMIGGCRVGGGRSVPAAHACPAQREQQGPEQGWQRQAIWSSLLRQLLATGADACPLPSPCPQACCLWQSPLSCLAAAAASGQVAWQPAAQQPAARPALVCATASWRLNARGLGVTMPAASKQPGCGVSPLLVWRVKRPCYAC